MFTVSRHIKLSNWMPCDVSQRLYTTFERKTTSGRLEDTIREKVTIDLEHAFLAVTN